MNIAALLIIPTMGGTAMRCILRTKWGSAFVVLGLAAFLSALSPPGVQANVITNGNFSTGTFEGWNASGDISIQNMSNLTAELIDKWDLTSWNTVMNGNFAMLRGQNNNATALLTTTIPFPTPSIPTSLTFDFAVAWNLGNYVPPPNALSDSYIKVLLNGENPHTFELYYHEIYWNTYSKNILTGTITMPMEPSRFIERLPSYDALSVTLVDVRLGLFDSIIGLDNFELEVVPVDSNAAPVPEPSACVLLMVSLAGTAWYTRKRSRFPTS